MKEVGKRLKVLRESLGLSQVKMAETIGSAPHSPASTATKTVSPPRPWRCSAAMRITLICRWIIPDPFTSTTLSTST